MKTLIPKVTVPEGESGDWKVSRFSLNKEDSDFTRLRAARDGRGFVPPGTYTQLTRGRIIVMSDTPDEMRDHYGIVRRASGNVLINGLGLGMVLGAVLAKPEVTGVIVVEQSEDVINLVAKHYADDRLTIEHASAFDYRPPKGIRFSAVWHDIWDDITTDNLPEMTTLKRRYCRKTDWQGCWCEETLRYRAKQEKRYAYW